MRKFFEGFYYKHQANGRTLALIAGKAEDCAFIQIITDSSSYNINFHSSEYKKSDKIFIKGNEFSNSGIKININEDEIQIKGELQYSSLMPIQYDIMGPFKFFPMECRHIVISMKHNVMGNIVLNGEKFDFDNGMGYIEGDSGYSFPKTYSWIQSNEFEENISIMASVALIPFMGFHFWGCICVLMMNGKEYRLATYKGARILRNEFGKIEISQGKFNLKISVNQKRADELSAPQSGKMDRKIKESASCPAELLFTENDRTIFHGKSSFASYEYADI